MARLATSIAVHDKRGFRQLRRLASFTPQSVRRLDVVDNSGTAKCAVPEGEMCVIHTRYRRVVDRHISRVWTVRIRAEVTGVHWISDDMADTTYRSDG